MAFITANGNKNGTIDINSLPDKMFIKANKVVDLYNARILGGDQRASIQPGAPDIQLSSATGGVTMITRDQLISTFRHPNGHSIKIAVLKSNTPYPVVRECNEEFRIFKLPNNCRGTLNGKVVNPKSYVVGKANQDGTVDKSSLSPVSEKLFKKLFKIPLQAIIKKHMDGGTPNRELNVKRVLENYRNKANNRGANRTGAHTQSAQPGGIFASIANSSNKQSIFGNSNQKPAAQFNFNSANAKPTKNTQAKTDNQPAESTAPYKVVSKAVGIQDNQLRGYIILNKSNGQKKLFNVDQVKQMCERKLIDNVMLVSREGYAGKYLRGNGIVLDNLPITRV